MENRELGLDEVEKRVNTLYNSLNLKTVMRTPDRAVDENDMPCVLIMEGDDPIESRGKRDFLGYPCARKLSVIVECWDYTSGDVRNIYKEVRKVVQANKGNLLTGVVIREEKAIGPFNLNIPGILGMRIVFGLLYQDSGPTFT